MVKRKQNRSFILPILFITLIPVLVSGFFIFKNFNSGSKKSIISKTDNWQTITNDTYGFSLKIPPGYTANTYNPEEWSIIPKNNESGVSFIVSLRPDTELTINQADQPHPTYAFHNALKDFVSAPGQIGCNADGEGVSSSCTGISKINPVVNPFGFSGFVYYVNQKLIYHNENKTVDNTLGPFYVFDVSKQTDYFFRSIVIGPQFAPSPQTIDEELVGTIANSLTKQ